MIIAIFFFIPCFFLFHLAEEEWIEEQLANNPDFDPNDEATGVNSGVDEQQPSVTNESAAQNGISENAEQTGEGIAVDGENKTSEARAKPKRFVR